MSPREKLLARTCLTLAALVGAGALAALLWPPSGSAEREALRREADRLAIDALRVREPQPPPPPRAAEPWFRGAPAAKPGAPR